MVGLKPEVADYLLKTFLTAKNTNGIHLKGHNKVTFVLDLVLKNYPAESPGLITEYVSLKLGNRSKDNHQKTHSLLFPNLAFIFCGSPQTNGMKDRSFINNVLTNNMYSFIYLVLQKLFPLLMLLKQSPKLFFDKMPMF